MNTDTTRCRPSPELLPLRRRIQCEAWKLAYADYLLRVGLLGKRAELLQHDFLPGSAGPAVRAAAGQPTSFGSGHDTHSWRRRSDSHTMATGEAVIIPRIPCLIY